MVKAKSDECEEDKFMLLPDELKLHIFSNLGRQDLQAVSATCRDFNRLSQDLSLWTELSLDISETERTLIYEVAKYPCVVEDLEDQQQARNRTSHELLFDV